MIDQTHLSALQTILGEANVVTDAATMVAYQTGARYDEGLAAVVLRPRTTEDVSATVAYCMKNGLHIVPQSGNTGLVSGSTPDGSGSQIVLSLDRLTARFDLDLDNRTLTLSGGFTLSEINRRLERHGMFFPIDLAGDPRIAGMAATNTGGSRYIKYGDVRRNVLGITVVLADASGIVLKLGSDLRKNNTGIDWKHVFIGSCGAFGIITECTINLEYLPRQTATAYLVPASGQSVMPLLRVMEQKFGAYLSAFEGMSGNAIAAGLSHVPSLRNPFQGGQVPQYVILLEISRSWDVRVGEQSLEAVLEEVLSEVWESRPELMADAVVGPTEQMWAMRHALSDSLRHVGKLIAFDLSFKRQETLTFCDYMRREMPHKFADVRICDFGHVGDGGVHFNLVVPMQSKLLEQPDFEVCLRDWVFQVAVETFGGSFSAEHGIGRKNQAFYDRFTDAAIKDLAGNLKSALRLGDMGAARFEGAAS